MQARTIRRGRIRLELDRGQVFTDDPGRGQPALVFVKEGYREFCGTYWCVLDHGETVDGCPLTNEEMKWLGSMQDEVEQFLYEEAK